MTRSSQSDGAGPSPLSEAELMAWVATAAGGRVTHTVPMTGGNRYRSWAVDVATADGRQLPLYLRYQMPRPASAEPYDLAREARIYRAVTNLDRERAVRMPRLLAVHGDGLAILTERAPGRADFRRLSEPGHRVAVVREFVAALAHLHRLDVFGMDLDGLAPRATIADCVTAEIDTWAAMYAETRRTDPLIDLALAWLRANLPKPADRPVLAHGDAGPGNFLFEDGHMTALLDWELAHAGDPMEDIAWFSMRCVMEPVPDFAGAIAEYAALSGRAIDRTRVLYHRVLVSTRIVIIRHRNVTGEPGNSIVSRALNRRLVVDALARAAGVALPPVAPVEARATGRTELYEGIIEDLWTKMAERSQDPVVVASAKNAAKVLKYLRDSDRLGPAIEQADVAELEQLLGRRPASVAAGQAELVAGAGTRRFSMPEVLGYFAGHAAREGQLAAASSGGLATRTFPDLP